MGLVVMMASAQRRRRILEDQNGKKYQEAKPVVILSPRPKNKSLRPEIKSPRPEVKSPRPEIKSPRLEIKSPRPEIKSPRPEIKSPRPEIKSPRPKMSLLKFKGFLWPKEGDAEIRRFTVDTDVAKSYCYLKEKLCVVFPLLKRSPDFHLMWKDSDGDSVAISSDEELSIAVDEMMSSGSIKIHVNLTKTGPTSVNMGPTHFGVICDGCDSEIVGFRYKCLECNDYDLCGNCEALNSHSEHFMLRISAPVSVCPPLTRRLAREIHRFSKKNEHHHRRGHSPSKHERKCPPGERGGGPREGRSAPFGGRCPAGQAAGNWLFNLIPDVHDLILPSGTNSQAPQDPSTIVKRVVETLQSFVDPMGNGTNPNPSDQDPKSTTKPQQQTAEKETPPKPPVAMETDSGKGDAPAQPSAPSATEPQPSSSGDNSPASLLMETDENSWTIIKDTAGLNMNDLGAVAGPSKEVKTPVESPDQNLYPTLPIGQLEQSNTKDPKVERCLKRMLSMGFNNEGGLLEKIIKLKNGNLEEVLEFFYPAKKTPGDGN